LLNSQFATLFLVLLLALGLRLLVWRWHEQYGLGGDETEYLSQALTLLRERRYVELNLMRPPLYTGFLAACIYLFDSLVQRLRLVQAVLSALTVLPVYALTLRLFGARRVALLAALLAALCYTLADRATELLTETLFLLGLALLLWLLVGANGQRSAVAGEGRRTNGQRSIVLPFYRFTVSPLGRSLLAGLALGGLALTRSVALPLLPLGALWLLCGRRTKDEGRRTKGEGQRANSEPRAGGSIRSWFSILNSQFSILNSLAFALAFALVVGPWTARNYVRYGALIVIDTTGAENLWLDNNPSASTEADPLGREAAKRQLYALGEDRAARQRLATQRGLEAIRTHPGWFAAKLWGEARRLFALEYFDDMRARRAIWLPPAEVWLRLLLGDALWLALLLAGAAGLWLAPRAGAGLFGDPRWLLVPWALYTALMSLLFHVELRYRLPLYPVLLPYAAWALFELGQKATGNRQNGRGARDVYLLPLTFDLRASGALVTGALLVGLTLAHRGYPAEAWALAGKHWQLWRAERALAAGAAPDARAAAGAALALDPDSALARVALARAALLERDTPGALAALGAAAEALPAQPYAHLLRGALLRAQGQSEAARRELAFERASRDDLQSWSARAFAPLGPPPAAVLVGAGLDLGFVEGFYLAESGFRWSTAEARVRLEAPEGARTLALRLASGRPDGAPPPRVAVLAGGRELARLDLAAGWHTYRLPLDAPPGPLTVTLRSDTFRPRDYDRASPDARALGVMVGEVGVGP
jgi:hypothetical protein